MPTITVRADGPYLVDDNGNETKLPGLARVTAGGGVVVRFPPRDVAVVEAIDYRRHVDCSDVQICILAVVLGGVTLAQVSAVRPGVAALVQAYMNSHGLTAGSAD